LCKSSYSYAYFFAFKWEKQNGLYQGKVTFLPTSQYLYFVNRHPKSVDHKGLGESCTGQGTISFACIRKQAIAKWPALAAYSAWPNGA